MSPSNLYLIRKIRYYLLFFPISRLISNWYLLPLLYLRLIKSAHIKLRNGYQFKVNHYLDVLTIKEIFLDNDYLLNLKSAKTIIDIGGNIGTFSVLASRKYPNAKIYTFEPVRSTFLLLKHNLSINNCNNVIPIQLGLSDKNQMINFYTNVASGLSSLIKTKGSRRTSIKTTSLKQVMNKYKITSCDFMKIDCEGAEYDILLKSPDSLLRKVKVFSLEYHDHLTKPRRHPILVKRLRSLRYKVKIKKHPIEEVIGIIFAYK